MIADKLNINEYDPETKRQSEEWLTPVSKTEESSLE
jgi:hypothetical protein